MISKIKFLGIVFISVSCSFYSFRGSIPVHIKSISISPIQNNTIESQAADDIKVSLENTFIDENILKLLPSGDSSSRLDIILLEFSDLPYSYSTDNISSIGYETLSEKEIRIKVKVSWYDLISDVLLFDKQFSGSGIYNPSQQDIGSDQIDNDNDTYVDDDDDDEFGPPRESAVKIASKKISPQIVNEIVSTW